MFEQSTQMLDKLECTFSRSDTSFLNQSTIEIDEDLMTKEKIKEYINKQVDREREHIKKQQNQVAMERKNLERVKVENAQIIEKNKEVEERIRENQDTMVSLQKQKIELQEKQLQIEQTEALLENQRLQQERITNQRDKEFRQSINKLEKDYQTKMDQIQTPEKVVIVDT